MTKIRKSQEALLKYLGNGIELDMGRQKIILTGHLPTGPHFTFPRLPWTFYLPSEK